MKLSDIVLVDGVPVSVETPVRPDIRADTVIRALVTRDEGIPTPTTGPGLVLTAPPVMISDAERAAITAANNATRKQKARDARAAKMARR